MGPLERYSEHEDLPELDEASPITQKINPDSCGEIDVTPVSENHDGRYYSDIIESQSRQIQVARNLLKSIRYHSTDYGQVIKIEAFFKAYPNDP